MPMTDGSPKYGRLYTTMCADLFHVGHVKLLEHCKARCEVLIVGVHSDDTIQGYKRSTIFSNEQRYQMVRTCKYVDEVVEDAPLVITKNLLDKHKIDMVVCATENAVENVDDYHQAAYDRGKLMFMERTVGLSTTFFIDKVVREMGPVDVVVHESLQSAQEPVHVETQESTAVGIPTMFASQVLLPEVVVVPKPKLKRLYTTMCADLFHVGHVSLLERCKALCEVLVVGIHSDATIQSYKRSPIFSNEQRYEMVRACKYVDEIVEDAPLVITKELLDKHQLDMVVCATEGGAHKVDDYHRAAADDHKFMCLPRTEGISTTFFIDKVVMAYGKVDIVLQDAAVLRSPPPSTAESHRCTPQSNGAMTAPWSVALAIA